MKTLTIASIFSNFDFYQHNYLNILNQSQSYYTLVEGAWINAYPFKKAGFIFRRFIAALV